MDKHVVRMLIQTFHEIFSAIMLPCSQMAPPQRGALAYTEPWSANRSVNYTGQQMQAASKKSNII